MRKMAGKPRHNPNQLPKLNGDKLTLVNRHLYPVPDYAIQYRTASVNDALMLNETSRNAILQSQISLGSDIPKQPKVVTRI